LDFFEATRVQSYGHCAVEDCRGSRLLANTFGVSAAFNEMQATRLLPELLLQGLGSAALQWISTKRGPPAADNYNVEF